MQNMLKNGLNNALRLLGPSSNNRGSSSGNSNNNNTSSGSTNNDPLNRDISSSSDVVELLDCNSTPANKVHSSITAALWALARTPALVNAIEHEESRYGEQQQLSYILRKLGSDEVLSNAAMAREAMEEAQVYLAATSMPRNDNMEVSEITYVQQHRRVQYSAVLWALFT